jgi:hypothetical protein
MSQISANAGACLVLEQKWAFQKPHFQPRAISSLELFLLKSAIISFVSESRTRVPTGTFNIKSGAFAQAHVFVPHFTPGSAFNTFLCLYSERVFELVVVSKYTSQPFHPFHPQGHPFGIYFSLLHDINQSHHFQEITFILTSSINIFF